MFPTNLEESYRRDSALQPLLSTCRIGVSSEGCPQPLFVTEVYRPPQESNRRLLVANSDSDQGYSAAS